MLMAQTASAGADSTWGVSAIVVFILAAVLGTVLLFLALLFRYLRASRQLLHDERMRSLEMGIPLEAPEVMQMQQKFLHNAFWISFWLVFSVPTAAFSAASSATRTVNGSLGVTIVIWSAAVTASAAAVICGTVLMIYSRRQTTDDGDEAPKLPKPISMPG